MKVFLLPFLFLLPIFCFTQTTVTFLLEQLPRVAVDEIGLRGSAPPLRWDASQALTATEEGYTITLDFPAGTDQLEFKFVYHQGDQLTWEGIANRQMDLSPGGEITETFRWDREQIIDVSGLPLLEPEALLADYALIETMVREVHPGTYRYRTEEEIDAALAKLRAAFSEPLSHGAAYLAISELTATLQCDHTKAGFNNQGAVINSIIHWQADKLPFTFKWVGDEMIVVYNASNNDALQRGAAVRRINGVAVADLRAAVIRHIGADGATDGNRVYKAQVNGYDFRYNAFDIFFPLLYPLERPEVVLEVEAPGASAATLVRVPTLTRDERAERLKDRYPEFPYTRDEMWRFEIMDDSIGLLTMNSFGLQGWKAMTLDYRQFLAETFATLNAKNIPHLILDIRENNGGNDEMADELFSYLASAKTAFEREGRTRYLTFPEALKPYLKTWGDNPWYYQLDAKKAEARDGYYIFKENFTLKPGKRKQDRYRGDVYLLTGPGNTSLAFYTALRFQLQELGTTVGRETGGNLNDINGGQVLFLTLPNSGIEIDFPVMGGFSTTPQPNQGVSPDISVEYQRQDITAGRDLEMEAVLEKIGGE